jgi:hypothetical protein
VEAAAVAAAAAAAALSWLQQCSSPKVFFKKFTLQNEA